MRWISAWESLWPSGKFLSGASKLVAGTAGGQAVIILSAPFLTRLYSPDQFGTFAVFTASIAFLFSIATLRYEIALPLPVTDGSAVNLLVLVLLTTTFFSLATAVAIAFCGSAVTTWSNTEFLEPYLWTIPIGVLLSGISSAFTYWALRKAAFGSVGWARFQQGGGMAIAPILLGYLNWGTLGLIAGYLIGLGAGSAQLVRFWLRGSFTTIRRVHILRILQLARRYRDLPLFSSWGALINTLGLQLPIILFASLYSPVTAGFYLLGQRVVNAPAALVAESVSKVFFISAVRARDAGRLSYFALSMYEALLKLSLAPFTAIAILAPEMFELIFGVEWIEAGVYMQWMVVWIAAAFIFVPLLTLYAVQYRHKVDLIFQVTLVAVRAIGIVIGSILGGPLLAVALFSLASALVYVGFGSRLLQISGVLRGDLVRLALREAGIAGLIGISVAAWRQSVVIFDTSAYYQSALLFLGGLVVCSVVLIRVIGQLKILSELTDAPAT